MRRGRIISLIERRSLSVGFPSRGGKESYASLKRIVCLFEEERNGVWHHFYDF
jgi:hypothetical protein